MLPPQDLPEEIPELDLQIEEYYPPEEEPQQDLLPGERESRLPVLPDQDVPQEEDESVEEFERRQRRTRKEEKEERRKRRKEKKEKKSKKSRKLLAVMERVRVKPTYKPKAKVQILPKAKWAKPQPKPRPKPTSKARPEVKAEAKPKARPKEIDVRNPVPPPTPKAGWRVFGGKAKELRALPNGRDCKASKAGSRHVCHGQGDS